MLDKNIGRSVRNNNVGRRKEMLEKKADDEDRQWKIEKAVENEKKEERGDKLGESDIAGKEKRDKTREVMFDLESRGEFK